MAKLKMTWAILGQSDLPGIEVNPLMRVAVNPQIRNSRDVFHQPPKRPGLAHNTLKLANHLQPITSRRRAPSARKIRTGGATNNAIKPTRDSMKIPNVTTEQRIRPAHHREADLLETTAEQIDTRKQRQNEL
nr:hypothetical protein [Ralstonia sp. LMG 32965]